MSNPQQPWQGPTPRGAAQPPAAPVYPPQPAVPGQPGYAPAPQGYAPAPPGYPQPVYPQPPAAAPPGYAQPGYAQPAYPAAPGQFPPPGYGHAPAQYAPQPGPPGYAQPAYPSAPGYPQAPAAYAPPAAPGYPGAPAPVPMQPAGYPGAVRPMPVQPVAVPQPVPVQPGSPYQPVPVRPVSVQPVAPTPVQPAAPMQPVRPVPVQPAQPVALAPQPVRPAAAPAGAPGVAPGSAPSAAPVKAASPRPAVAAATAAAAVAAPVAPGAARPVPVSSAARPIPVAKTDTSVVRTDAEEEQEPDVETKIVKNAPPWLISLIVHVTALVVMAFWYLAAKESRQVELEVVYAEDIGVQLEDDKLTTGLMENIEIEEPAVSEDKIAVDDPLAAPPQVDIVLDGMQSTDTLVAPSIGLALSGREKGMKQALLGKYGGTATTEAAVRLGLEWLKRNQEKSGTWSLTGPYSSGSGIENRCAATAMALLAFQGAGHTHKEGDFQKEVARGWKALLAMQDRDGMFYHEGVHHQQLYAQAQATIAICELYGMTKDKEYKAAAQRAIDHAVKIQAPEGGWRYTPGTDSDTSVTGWYVIALQSAMMAGLEVPSPTLEKISKFLDSVQSENGTRYAYRPGGGPTETMTAEALLCRQYLSWKHDDPRLADGVKYILSNPIKWDFDNTNVYYWYYATQVTHHMEGEAWKEWNDVMREVIPKVQEKSGAEAGSWNPSNDRWGSHGGRLYETCLCIYMLEVYYRHLPIYKWKQQ